MYMWISILINIIISCMIIFIGHQLWIYLQEKYSVKKTKDIVGSQIQKYKTIIEGIQKQKEEVAGSQEFYTDIKEDLENFIHEL